MLARFTRRPTLTLVGAAALVIAIANPAAAPPGDLDPTFDGDGKVTTDFTAGFDAVTGVAIQADGKILAAGFSDISGNTDFTLARYNPNGSLDATFDGDGKVATDFAGDLDDSQGVAIQADGKIVAAGSAFISGDRDFALARYNADGTLDASFDGDGKVTTDVAGTSDLAMAVDIQADGRIVTAGFTSVSGNSDFALARYNADGTLDATFDGDGKVTTDVAGGTDMAHGVAIQGDGMVVVAGEALVSGNDDFALARYNADGTLDATFDGDGKVTTNFAGSFDEVRAVAIQADGRIVAAGPVHFPSATTDFGLARYNTNGSLDTTFDGDGKVTTDFGSNELANGVTIQGDDKIVAAGWAVGAVSGNVDFALARYNPHGSPDSIFSGDGKVTTDFAGGTDEAHSVAIQANGKIVAAGAAVVSGSFDFALARYTCFRRTSRPTSIPICPQG